MAGQTPKLNPFATAMQTASKSEAIGVVPDEEAESLVKESSNGVADLTDQNPQDMDPNWEKKFAEMREEELKKQLLSQEQHDRVNPADQTEIFAAQKEEDRRKEEALVQELRQLATQRQIVPEAQPKVLEAPVVATGQRGSSANGLLEKAKQFIYLHFKNITMI